MSVPCPASSAGSDGLAARSTRSQAASSSRPTGVCPWSTAKLPRTCLCNSQFAPSPGLSVQYSLVGGTSPTVTNGSVTPGTLLNTSKIGIDFVNLKVGVDLFVDIGGGSYEMVTAGGAGNPSSSSIALNGALFSSGGATVPVTVLTSSGNIGCTTGNNCTATVTGFLAGDGTNNGSNNGGGNPNGAAPPYLGLNYSFGNTGGPLSGFVSGAAAFGRDLPVGNAVGYAFSSTEPLHAAGTPTMALGDGPAFVIGDTTASGLSIGQINVNLDNGSSYQNFSAAPAAVLPPQPPLNKASSPASSVGNAGPTERSTIKSAAPSTHYLHPRGSMSSMACWRPTFRPAAPIRTTWSEGRLPPWLTDRCRRGRCSAIPQSALRLARPRRSASILTSRSVEAPTTFRAAAALPRPR